MLKDLDESSYGKRIKNIEQEKSHLKTIEKKANKDFKKGIPLKLENIIK